MPLRGRFLPSLTGRYRWLIRLLSGLWVLGWAGQAPVYAQVQQGTITTPAATQPIPGKRPTQPARTRARPPARPATATQATLPPSHRTDTARSLPQIALPVDTTGDADTLPGGLSYLEPDEVRVDSIYVTGVRYLDPDALVSLTGIRRGDRISIPGEAVTGAVRKLWEQGLISDVEVVVPRRSATGVDLEFRLTERPRLARFAFKGLRRGEANDLREKVALNRGRIVNEALIKNTQNIVQRYFVAKGFFGVQTRVRVSPDSGGRNTVTIRIEVDKGPKVKIEKLTIEGVSEMSEARVRRQLKDTKERNPWRIFKPSRFVRSKFDKDRGRLEDFYRAEGYRDFAILSDSVYRISPDRIGLHIRVEEGRRYYFGDINWTGNYLYDDQTLTQVLGIRKGQVYNQALLDKKLTFNPNGADVSSLYMDDGYLFFNVQPVEVAIDGDSIDVELRVYEGAQATISRVNIEGNTKTSDRVVLREIRTLPGQKFSRADLIRTNRELASLGYFDPEQIGINPVPNMNTGTVDINYSLVEKPSDQIQLSGGWGGFFGFVGTLQLVFNNFSLRKAGQLSNWRPLPAGDGQRLSLSYQANGRQFMTLSSSFTEPWLGGRRPNAFTIGVSHSLQQGFAGSNLRTLTRSLNVTSVSASLGRRVRWPDDYFSLSHSAQVQRFNLFNFGGAGIPIANGSLYQLSLINTLSRNSVNNPIFPTAGSSFALSANITPPWSLMDPGRVDLPAEQRFRLVEFHKWMFDAAYYVPLAKNLVWANRTHFGAIGTFNRQIGIGPFERFKVGGSGIAGFNFLIGYDIIGLRGYADNAIGPPEGGIVYNKYVSELRYAITTGQAATIYVLGFIEAGNNWGDYRSVNPFNVYRSSGGGVRVMMPAFGLLGVDYGWAFDGTRAQRSGFTFSIGQQIR